MSTLTTPTFWKATAERAVRTVAQTAVATIGTTALIHEVDWTLVGSASALAGVLAVLTAVGTDAVTGKGPSATSSEELTRPEATPYERAVDLHEQQAGTITEDSIRAGAVTHEQMRLGRLEHDDQQQTGRRRRDG